MRARLSNISRASTFYSQDVAEKVISKAIRENQTRIITLVKHLPKEKSFTIDYISNTPIGFGVTKGSQSIEELYKARVVFLTSEYNGQPYYILTAYPKFN
ncbi:RNase A-like domain-containing protein [Photorhabdus bodei]|uniref:RNase A-like domain-containing protein n=1 Tax=Photorhabdus bodei TaxID=2029681 RepID=UPI002B4B9C7E|nr:RNase A-like domain-containing protein [Photorhabdus bodei]